MSRIVFILGAGASRQAGGPLMSDFLDLADELRKTKGMVGQQIESFNLVFKGIAQLQSTHSKANLDIDNIEAVFAAFEMASLFGRLGNLTQEEVDQLGVAIRRLIFRTIELKVRLPASPDKSGIILPPPYGEFGALLKKQYTHDQASLSVISLNYDVALDHALLMHRIPIDYCLGAGADKEALPIMKLHGSINWAYCEQCKSIVPWYIEKFLEQSRWDQSMILTGSVVLDIASKIHEFAHCGQLVSREPMIVPPTWNKTQYYVNIAPVWKQAANELSCAENIFVIGYSLPQTDEFFRYLYALGTVGDARLRRIWVFDPDEAVGARYESLLGPTAKKRFQFHKVGFNSAINIINREL